MNKTEFKLRMKSLKSYRELNPGKGYWDWKVELFKDGGEELSELRKQEIETQVRKAFYPRSLEDAPKKSFSELSKDYERRRSQARWDRTKDDLKSLLSGLSKTVGTAAAVASLFGGGGWSLARLLNGNRNSAVGRVLAPTVLPANTVDTAGDIVDFVGNPSWSGAAEIGVGLGLGRWKDFGSRARLAAELGSLVLNANNIVNSYDEGGEVPPDNSIVRVNPITGKPIANGMAYTTIPSKMSTPEELLEAAETALSFIPYVGDAISVKDLTQSINNKDWLGASLAGLSLIPFVPRLWRSKASKVARPIPEVHPNYFQELMQKMQAAIDKKKQVTDEFYKLQDNAYESLIDNEDAFRRAVNADNTAGTRYKDVYSEYLRKYNQRPSKNNDDLILMRLTDDMPSNTKAQVNPNNLDWININDRYANPNELDPMFLLMNPGLVRHELGHITDEKAGLDYVDKLGKRSKFESEEKLREMYPSSYKTIQSYLLRGSEIKSHMNEFREFLRSKHEDGVKETVRSMREKLDKYRDEFRNLKVLFDAYKSKRQFVKDYNTIPLIGTSALGINYYLNQLEEK